MTINTCITCYRSNRRHNETESLDSLYDIAEEVSTRTSDIKEMYEMISRLRKLDRAIILLWLDEKSYDDIVAVGSGFAVGFALYFIVLGILNAILLYKICRIDLSIMTVTAALEKTVSLQIMRFRFKRVAYAMLIPMLIAMLYIFCNNGMLFLITGIAAVFFGCLAGYMLNRNVERNIHRLKNALLDELSTSDR